MPSFYRTLRTALLMLRRQPTRSALTCVGITIGIAAVVSLVEIGQGTEQKVRETIGSLGSNYLLVEAGAYSSSGVSLGSGTAVTLTPGDRDAILRECPAVRWAAPGVDCRTQVIHGNRNWQPWKVLGTSPDYLKVRDWELEEGEPFTDLDVSRAAGVCLLGQTPLRELFDGESPIGKQVRVNGVPLTVIGVLRHKGANMMGLDQDDLILAPWTTVKLRINGSRLKVDERSAAASSLNQVNTLSRLHPGQPGGPYPLRSALQVADFPQVKRSIDLDDIYVSAVSAEAIPDAIEQITLLLRERHHIRPGQPDDFGIRNMTEISRAVASTSKRMTDMLFWVALVSLAVGGVGIMSMMLATVTERTREIGIRMAVGARPRDVRRQFLAEAVILCLLGGIAGVLLGRGTSMAVTALMGWAAVPSLTAIVAAVALSAGVGIVFGYYPAWKASRLDPIEALRHE
jgi:ABC-type antimicrobial peptide transport system permease subunit